MRPDCWITFKRFGPILPKNEPSKIWFCWRHHPGPQRLRKGSPERPQAPQVGEFFGAFRLQEGSDDGVLKLASFKLNYVSPENHKIGKSGWWKWREKVEFGGEKQASRCFCWMKMNRFDTNFKMERSKKWDDSQKLPKMAEKAFWKKLGRSRKSIQFGKLDQKSLFFIWFFIDYGQKTL